ncbi:MAG: hypothetical protein CMP77_14685 [Flavobacterium sp.]|nr:hypothetical protein [Flavobacterium sp.]|tara:strand:+ start:8418 stop:8876 length:459 start_codon:yes stop_codon:yes gene_type:complete
MELFNFKSLKTKYFWIAIVFIGTVGIWLPVILALALSEEVVTEEIPINLTTFYIAIYFAGCVDSIFRHIDILDNKYELKSKIFTIIILILLLILLIISTVWLKIKGQGNIALFLSLIGSFIGLSFWWYNNKDTPTFSDKIINESNETHGNNW